MRGARKTSLRALLLALGFYAFFEASKHLPPLARVNVFADDPYDGIGSIGVQLALFLAGIALLRAFRPGIGHALRRLQQQRVAKACAMAAAATLLTMLGDAAALLRHVAIWETTREGRWVAAWTVLLAAWSGAELTWSWNQIKVEQERRAWLPGAVATSGVLALLAIYPERLRLHLAGELVTALAGGAMLILPLSALAHGWPREAGLASDIVDDVIAWCEWIKAKTPSLARFYTACDGVQRSAWALKAAGWINPRRYRWRLSLATGTAFGLGLVAEELRPSGVRVFAHPGKTLMVVAIFIGLQTTSVVMGRGLLADSLEIFRVDRRTRKRPAA